MSLPRGFFEPRQMSAIQSIQCQGVPRFIKKPFIVLEPDIFVRSLISLLSGGDLLIVDTAYIILEPRSFQHLLICLM